jgi:hypothetical protein
VKVHVAVPVVFTGAIVAAAYFSQNALRNRPGAFREGDAGALHAIATHV